MKGVWLLARREIRDAFSSPLVYVLTGLFGFIMGWLFFNYLATHKEPTQYGLLNSVLIPFFGNMNFIFLFLAPLITMRLFAEEKRHGTLSLLLLSDLSHWQIIWGKFISSLVTVLFMLSTTGVVVVALAMSGYSNWPVVISSYVGIILSVTCYLATGIFASSLTKNQIIAALLSFAISMGIMLLVITTNATNNYIVSQIFFYLSTPSHFEAFTRGAFRSYDILYFASFVGFFFYLTHLSLESRKW